VVHVDGHHAGRLSRVGLAVNGYHQRTPLNQHRYVLAMPLLVVNKKVFSLLKPKEGDGLEGVLLCVFVKHEREVALQRTHLAGVNRREHDLIRDAGRLFYAYLRVLHIV